MSNLVRYWNDERCEALRMLWKERFSASEIAFALGGGVTRNAVIGKIHRLNLEGRTARQHPQPRGDSGGGVIVRIRSKFTQRSAKHGLKMEGLFPPIDATENKGITFFELTDTTCHYPIGDPSKENFRFCGATSLKKWPYCAHHFRLCYTRTSK